MSTQPEQVLEYQLVEQIKPYKKALIMTAKMKRIEVDEKIISITSYNEEDYICLTDMVRGEEGNDHIRNWMRNRNTIEFLGLWEQLYNPNFKSVEFDTFNKR